MERVLEELQMLPFRVLRQVGLLDHANERLAHIDGMNRPTVLREGRVEGLHDEARADAKEPLSLDVVTKLVRRDLLWSTLFEDLLTIVDLELGEEIAFSRWLEPCQDREHRRDLERMRRDLEVEAGTLEELPIDLHLLREAEIVGHLDDDDTIKNRLVGVVGLESLPLRLVAVCDDHGVDVDGAMATRCRNHLLLRRRDHGVKIFGLVLEDLDELHHAAITDVEGATQLQYPRITL